MTKKQKFIQIMNEIKKEKQYEVVHSNYENGKISLLLTPNVNVMITKKPIDEFIDDRIKYAKKVLKFLEGLKK